MRARSLAHARNLGAFLGDAECRGSRTWQGQNRRRGTQPSGRPNCRMAPAQRRRMRLSMLPMARYEDTVSDFARVGARRILFVAHREEILNQAAETFIRIRPTAQGRHLLGPEPRCRSRRAMRISPDARTSDAPRRFAPQHFDYVVIDEFHHAAAATYRRLLEHFAPAFLLGLTATPHRTDQSDILSHCDDNLVFTRSLFEGIRANLLSPFHYYGILDESVDYREVPWRNGRFDPEQLSNKLATLARARHALVEWRIARRDEPWHSACQSPTRSTWPPNSTKLESKLPPSIPDRILDAPRL